MSPTPAAQPVSIELRDVTARQPGPGSPPPGDPSRRDLSPSESAAAAEEIRQAITEAGGRIEIGHDLETTLHPGGGITSGEVGSLVARFETGTTGRNVLRGSAATFAAWLRNRSTRSVRVRYGDWATETRGPGDLDRVVAELGLRVDPPTAVAPPPEPVPAAKLPRVTVSAKPAKPVKAAAKATAKPKTPAGKSKGKPAKPAKKSAPVKKKPAAKAAAPAKKPKRR